MIYQIVIQVDTHQDNLWKSLPARLKAMREDLGDCEIEVVLHSSAVKSLPQLDKPIEQVSIIACQRALIGNHIPEESIPSFVHVVPSGLAHLVKKQADGWAYLKV